MIIHPYCVVTLRYCMKNSKGDVLENILGGPAIHYIHGTGKVLPALEAALNGLAEGAEKTICLSPGQGYTDLDDDFEVQVIIDHVREASQDEIAKGLAKASFHDPFCGPDCKC